MDPVIKELFDTLYLSASGMTTGQLDFIASCKKQFQRSGTISDKQLAVLNDIKKYFHPAQRVSMRVHN